MLRNSLGNRPGKVCDLRLRNVTQELQRKMKLFRFRPLQIPLMCGPGGGALWARSGGASDAIRDEAVDMAVDNNGTSYVLSTHVSTNVLAGPGHFHAQAWFLTKYNSAGIRVWAKSFSTEGAAPFGSP